MRASPSVRRSILLTAIALAVASGSLFVERAPRPSCKPVAPIDLEAEIVGDPSAPFGLTARASSQVGGEVELEIVLPDGVTHVGGERKSRGRHCNVRVDLRAVDLTPREIVVRATISEGNARLTRIVPMAIFGAPRSAPRGRAVRNSRGEAIREFSP